MTITKKPLGICPACGETVKAAEDAVWTCPSDLNENNPYFRQMPEDVARTAAEKESSGFDGECLDSDSDSHVPCPFEDMPLHLACYARGNY